MNYVKNIWPYFQKLGRSWQIGSNYKEILKVYYTFSHYKTFFSFLRFYIFLHKSKITIVYYIMYFYSSKRHPYSNDNDDDYDDDDDELLLWYRWQTKWVYLYFQPRPLSEICTIVNLWHGTRRIWTHVKLEFRLSWIKLSSSDNHYTMLSHYSVSFKQSFSTLSLRTKIRNTQSSFIVAPEDKCP